MRLKLLLHILPILVSLFTSSVLFDLVPSYTQGKMSTANLPDLVTTRNGEARRSDSAKEQFSSIWTIALEEYKTNTGHDLMVERKIENARDLSRTMEDMERAFNTRRKGDEGWQTARNILKHCVVPLQQVSSIAAQAIALTPYAPAGVIFGAGMQLINACDGVTKAYDLVTELLQECKTFTERLEKLSEIEMQNDLVVKLTSILKFIMDLFAQCEHVISNGRLKNYLSKVRGKGKDDLLQASLERLKKYFTEEEMFTVAQIYVTAEKTSLDVTKLVDFSTRMEVRSIIESLSTGFDISDVFTKQREFNSKSKYTPPVWILAEEAYQKWLTKEKFLWITGNVGAGKTTILSYLAAILSTQGGSSFGPEIRANLKPSMVDVDRWYAPLEFAVARFYGSYDVQGEQRSDLVFQCLIRQLLQQLESSAIERALARCHQVKNFLNVSEENYDIREGKGSSGKDNAEEHPYLSSNTWARILNEIASEFRSTYILIDALDKEETGYEDLLVGLGQLTAPSVKLLITSRDDSPIQDAVTMSLNANSSILSYVLRRLERIRDFKEINGAPEANALPRVLVDDSEFKDITKSILSNAQGNFYYAEASINLLLQETNPDDVRDKKTKLLEGLSEVIRMDVERVKLQKDRRNRQIGLKALMFATFACRSLSIEEMQHAVELLLHLGVRETSSRFPSASRHLAIENIVECSCGLLRLNDQTNFIYVDKATTTYCRNSGIFEKAHYEIAQTCLAFLDSMSFSLRSESKEEHWEVRQMFPLYAYAAQYWGVHVREAGESQFLKKSSHISLFTLLNRKLFCNAVASANHDRFPARVWNWNKNDTWRSLRHSKDAVVPAAHLLVFFDLPRTLDWWLRQNPHQVECGSATGMTPLYMACLLNRVRVAEILLFDYHADPTTRGSPPAGYCLAGAIGSQSSEIVQRILYVEDKKTLELTNWHKRRPLGEAVMRGNMDIVRMLLDAALAMPNPEEQLLMPDQGGVDALHEIAMAPNSSIDAIDLLVGSKGGKAFLHTQTKEWGDTALHLAAVRGRDPIVKHLIELGADPSKGQRLRQTPLMLAVQGLHVANEKTIDMLMAVTKEYELRDVDGRTIWHHAARMGRPKILAQLIRLTPKSLFNITNVNGDSPIKEAAGLRRHGWAYCIWVLLRDCPHQIGSEDAYAVLNALIPDRSGIAVQGMKLLIEQHPVKSWPYCRGQTTLLHKILHNGNLEMLQMTWGQLGDEAGRILEFHDVGGSTPLVLTAGHSNPVEEASAKALFLVEQGANIDACDYNGRTALHHAVARDLPDLVTALLDKGAGYRIRDSNGFAALETMKADAVCAQIPQVISAKANL